MTASLLSFTTIFPLESDNKKRTAYQLLHSRLGMSTGMRASLYPEMDPWSATVRLQCQQTTTSTASFLVSLGPQVSRLRNSSDHQAAWKKNVLCNVASISALPSSTMHGVSTKANMSQTNKNERSSTITFDRQTTKSTLLFEWMLCAACRLCLREIFSALLRPRLHGLRRHFCPSSHAECAAQSAPTALIRY